MGQELQVREASQALTARQKLIADRQNYSMKGSLLDGAISNQIDHKGELRVWRAPADIPELLQQQARFHLEWIDYHSRDPDPRVPAEWLLDLSILIVDSNLTAKDLKTKAAAYAASLTALREFSGYCYTSLTLAEFASKQKYWPSLEEVVTFLQSVREKVRNQQCRCRAILAPPARRADQERPERPASRSEWSGDHWREQITANYFFLFMKLSAGICSTWNMDQLEASYQSAEDDLKEASAAVDGFAPGERVEAQRHECSALIEALRAGKAI